MKKFALVMLASLMVFGTSVFATDDTNDGIVTWTSNGADFVTDATINRSNAELDENGAGQLAQVNVKMYAYIPCYLKMEFVGNLGKSTAESFGPKKDGKQLGQAITDASVYNITFDNEMGGFVDADWKSKGAGRNIEVAPGSNVYIAACDTFHVKIYSNDAFKYDVISGPLTQNGGSNKLNLEMGTSTTLKGAYSNTVFDAEKKAVNVGTGNATQTLEYFHKFRVPYSTTTVHGGYTGDITFKAYTI